MSGWITVNDNHLDDNNNDDNKNKNDEILLFNMRNRYSQGLGYIYSSNTIGDTYWGKAKEEFENVINMIKDNENSNSNSNITDYNNDNDSNYKERYHLYYLAIKNLARCYDKESKRKGISNELSLSLSRSTLSLSLEAAAIMDNNNNADIEKINTNDSALLLRIGKLSMILG